MFINFFIWPGENSLTCLELVFFFGGFLRLLCSSEILGLVEEPISVIKEIPFCEHFKLRKW